MKKTWVILIMVFSMVTGLGLAMSDCPDDDIVVPKENFKIEFTDIDGVKTIGASIAFECKTFFTAKRGAATIFIPFEQIREITMLNNNEVVTKELPEVSMKVVMIDGTEYESKGNSNQELTGLAGFGKFRIRLDHIKNIKFIDDSPAPMEEIPESADSTDD